MRPAARTMAKLRSEGWIVDKVEHWNAHSRRRVDLYNFIDLLAICPNRGVLAVQCCGRDFVWHRKKILAERRAYICLQAGIKIEIWGWRKLKAGWRSRVEEIVIDDEWTF